VANDESLTFVEVAAWLVSVAVGCVCGPYWAFWLGSVGLPWFDLLQGVTR
jgi:hypothetical protein